MGILASSFVEGVPQEDGRWYVSERHETDDARVITYEYLSDGTIDPQMVLEERAALITATLAAREAARQAVTGTEVPYTKYEFLDRFTSTERINIRAFAGSNSLYAPDIDDFMKMLEISGDVFMTLARPGIEALLQLGLLTNERAAVIGVD